MTKPHDLKLYLIVVQELSRFPRSDRTQLRGTFRLTAGVPDSWTGLLG